MAHKTYTIDTSKVALVPHSCDDVMIDAAYDALGSDEFDNAPVIRACEAYVAAAPKLPDGAVEMPPPFQLGPKLFSFQSFQDWVNQAQRIWKRHGVDSRKTVCLDQKGRLCAWGEHFMKARDEGAFPMDVYLLREDMKKPEGGSHDR